MTRRRGLLITAGMAVLLVAGVTSVRQRGTPERPARVSREADIRRALFAEISP